MHGEMDKKGGINESILTDIFTTIDKLGVFEEERKKGIVPFILVDGHHSRFSDSFMSYITNPEHPWRCCIGVPYGTALWQIGDSEQLNGMFKQEITKEKESN